MNDYDEPSKTVAILALQSPVLCASDEKWQRVAELLSRRLYHPVVVINLDDHESTAVDLQASIEWYANQGFHRFVILPIGHEDFDLTELIAVVAWMRAKGLSLRLHVARSWTTKDWAQAMLPALANAMSFEDCFEHRKANNHETGKVVLFVGSDGEATGQELASLVYQCQQFDDQIDFRYCSLKRNRPTLQKAIAQLDSVGAHSILLIAWRMSSSELSELFRELGTLHEIELKEYSKGCAWSWDRFSKNEPESIELLEYAGWNHVALGLYLDALSNRSLERYFVGTQCETSADSIELGLIALDQRIDAMLPSEYQGRAEEISPQSMGSATIPSIEFGKVPWGEIWTSFCDLAMAGGPPHRGRLLEAVTAEDVKENLPAYEKVLAEIIRGIEMVTGLKTVWSEVLGWVGIQCDDEHMAAWLMRAIIVENVMVRREGAFLYLPAGPQFTIKREIKNVITSVAKTVHYWRAHLRQRS